MAAVWVRSRVYTRQRTRTDGRAARAFLSFDPSRRPFDRENPEINRRPDPAPEGYGTTSSGRQSRLTGPRPQQCACTTITSLRLAKCYGPGSPSRMEPDAFKSQRTRPDDSMKKQNDLNEFSARGRRRRERDFEYETVVFLMLLKKTHTHTRNG